MIRRQGVVPLPIRAGLALLAMLVMASAGQGQSLAQTDELLRQARQQAAQGKNREAADLAGRALAIRRQLLGSSDIAVAAALSWQASFLDDAGDYSNARASYEEALAICRKVRSGYHANTDAPCRALSRAYGNMPEYDARMAAVISLGFMI